MPVKLLVVGGGSSFGQLAKKVDAVIKKSGSFRAALIAGEIQSNSPADLKDVKFAIPTYYASQSFDESGERKELPEHNLTFVGESGRESIDGLTIVFIAEGYDDPPGKIGPDPEKYPFPLEVQTAIRNAGAFGAGFRGIDVLISVDRPFTGDNSAVKASKLVSAAAMLLRPRYHVCGGKPHTFLSMGPHKILGANHGSRLIALGSTSPAPGTKEKWLYAANVTPLKEMESDQMEGNVSERAPYLIEDSESRKRRLALQQDQPAGGFFYDMPKQRGNDRKRRGGLSDRNRDRATRARFEGHPVDAKCWFCLGNEKDIHLVVSVGTQQYVALAKGGLTPHHVLLAPIPHVRSASEMSKESFAELEKYIEALTQMFREKLDSDILVFERVVNPRGGALHSHTQIQVVPIPKSISEKASEKLGEEAAAAKLALEELPKGKNFREFMAEKQSQDRAEYFYIHLPDGKEAVQLISLDRERETDRDERRPVHPMQFGRRFAASLLGMMHRVDWKRCITSTDQESKDADAFRELFDAYDPLAG